MISLLIKLFAFLKLSKVALSAGTSARWRCWSCVATPTGQASVWQDWLWMQPIAIMKPRAMLHQSAPSAIIRAMSKADMIMPEQPILTLSRRPAPTSALCTKVSPSRRGMPI